MFFSCILLIIALNELSANEPPKPVYIITISHDMDEYLGKDGLKITYKVRNTNASSSSSASAGSSARSNDHTEYPSAKACTNLLNANVYEPWPWGVPFPRTKPYDSLAIQFRAAALEKLKHMQEDNDSPPLETLNFDTNLPNFPPITEGLMCLEDLKTKWYLTPSFNSFDSLILEQDKATGNIRIFALLHTVRIADNTGDRDIVELYRSVMEIAMVPPPTKPELVKWFKALNKHERMMLCSWTYEAYMKSAPTFPNQPLPKNLVQDIEVEPFRQDKIIMGGGHPDEVVETMPCAINRDILATDFRLTNHLIRENGFYILKTILQGSPVTEHIEGMMLFGFILNVPIFKTY